MDKTTLQSDLIFDVGMHKGEDTAYYLKKGFRVVGFEADPELADHCRQLFSDHIVSNRLNIVEGAVLARDAQGKLPDNIDFYKNTDHTVWGTVIPTWADRNTQLGSSSIKITVPVIDFSQCLKQHGIPHYMKIDIEGMDRVCLEELKDFQQKPSYISIEAEKVVFNKLKNELSLFEQLGYTSYKAVQQSGISLQSEPKPPLEGEYSNHKFKEGSSGMFGKDLPLEWKSQSQIAMKYKYIFGLYAMFGDTTLLRKSSFGQFSIKVLEKLTGKPIPGWYDTHAKHGSIS